MKKYVVSVVSLAVVLGGAVSPALADRGSGIRGFFDRFRQEQRDEDEAEDEPRQESRSRDEDAASKSAELRWKLQRQHNAERTERLKEFWDKAGKRLQGIVNRESQMSERIAEQLARKKSAGMNTSEQEALLRDADAAISTAQTSLTEATLTMKRLRDEQAPIADMIVRARELHKTVIGDIRVALRALVDVIVSMRGMSAVPTQTISPTP